MRIAYNKGQSGVALLEALLGILLFSIGILAVVGLQAVAVRTVADSQYRMEAAFLANDIVGQIWANRGNLSLYEYSGGTAGAVLSPWVKKVEGTLPGAADNPPTIEVDGSVITVTVRWQHPEEANLDPKPEPHSHSVVAVMDYNDD
jgi:type IV pilus assembly protein PilV